MTNFVSVLEQEGIKFGVAIPRATPLSKLITIGTESNASELAKLIREYREQIATNENHQYCDQTLKKLTVPISGTSERISLDRIVQKIGGRLRSSLGGWIDSL